jgi:hypothetical protein
MIHKFFSRDCRVFDPDTIGGDVVVFFLQRFLPCRISSCVNLDFFWNPVLSSSRQILGFQFRIVFFILLFTSI